jgi:hypothetical protein
MLTQEDGLICPNCGENFLHHEKVEVFARRQEAGDLGDGGGVHVTVENGQALISKNMTENPSPRRDGISIEFSCENCPHRSRMTIIQHKGSTYLEFELVGYARKWG